MRRRAETLVFTYLEKCALNFIQTADCNTVREVLSWLGRHRDGQKVLAKVHECIELLLQEKPPFLSWDRKLKANLHKHSLDDLADLLLNFQISSTFFKLLVHPGMTCNELAAFMRPAIEVANQLKAAKWEVVVTVFLDEFNTSRIPGVLETLVCNKRIAGQEVPENIFFAASINPSGVQGYNVGKLPQSMMAMRQVLRPLGESDKRKYIRNAILQRSFQGEDEVVELALVGYSCLEDWYEESTRGDGKRQRCVVSQRDIQRIGKVAETIEYLSWLAVEGLGGEGERTVNSYVTAIYLCLAMQLHGSQERLELTERLNRKMAEWGEEKREPTSCWGRCIEEVQQGVVEQVVNSRTVEVRKGMALCVAATNIFLVLVSAVSKVSLLLIGPPATGKTNATQVVGQNMRGASSPTSFFRRLSEKHGKLVQFTLQASCRTGPEHITDLVNECRAKQKSMRQGVTIQLVIDEAGHPSDEKQALKALHEMLDDQEFSVVCLSNRNLDHAKQNRMLCAQCDDINLRELCIGCLRVSEKMEAGDPVEKEVNGLVAAHDELQLRAPTAYYIRDFIYLFRYLSVECRPEEFGNGITPEELLRGLEYNLGGNTSKLAQEVFFKCMREHTGEEKKWTGTDFRDTRCVIRDARERQAKKKLVGYLRPRNQLLVDVSTDLNNVKEMVEEGWLGECTKSRIVVSNFTEDATLREDSKVLADIIYAMEEGSTIVLYNGERISTALFDLLNQSYMERHTADGRTKYFANIAVGTHTYRRVVHEDFRLVFVMSAKEIEGVEKKVSWAAFLSRFERQVVSHKCSTDKMLSVERFVNKVVQRNNVKPHWVSGTLPSLEVCVSNEEKQGGITSSCNDLCVGMLTADQRRVMRINERIMETTTLEGVLRCRDSAKNWQAYLKLYLEKQEHFDLTKLIERQEKRVRAVPCVPYVISTGDHFNGSRLHKLLQGKALVCKVDLKSRRADVERILEEAKSEDHHCVLLLDKFSTDYATVLLIYELLVQAAKEMSGNTFASMLLMLPTSYPTTFSQQHHSLYMDTLAAPSPHVTHLLGMACGVEGIGSYERKTTSLRTHVARFVYKHAGRLDAACCSVEQEVGQDMQRVLRFYSRKTKLEDRLQIARDIVQDDEKSVKRMLEEANAFADSKENLENCLKETEKDFQEQGVGPFSVHFCETVSLRGAQQVNRFLWHLFQNFGLMSLAAGRVKGLSEKQLFLCNKASKMAVKGEWMEWSFPPSCPLNPWLHGIVLNTLQKLPPRPEELQVDYVRRVFKCSEIQDLLRDDKDSLDSELWAYTNDACRLIYWRQTKERDETLSKALVDHFVDLFLSYFEGYEEDDAWLVLLYASSIHLFPKTVSEMLGFKGVLSVLFELGETGALLRTPEDSISYHALTTRKILHKIGEKQEDEASQILGRVVRAHRVTRALLVDRENGMEDIETDRTLLELDMVLHLCHLPLETWKLQKCVSAVCKETSSLTIKNRYSLLGVSILLDAIKNTGPLLMNNDKQNTNGTNNYERLCEGLFTEWLTHSSDEVITNDPHLRHYLLGQRVGALRPITSKHKLKAVMEKLAEVHGGDLHQLVAGFKDPFAFGSIWLDTTTPYTKKRDTSHIPVDALLEVLVERGALSGVMSVEQVLDGAEAAVGSGPAELVMLARMHIAVNGLPLALTSKEEAYNAVEEVGQLVEKFKQSEHWFFDRVEESKSWQKAVVARMVGGAAAKDLMPALALLGKDKRVPWRGAFATDDMVEFRGVRREMTQLPLLLEGCVENSAAYRAVVGLLEEKEWKDLRAVMQQHGSKEVTTLLLGVVHTDYYETGRCDQLKGLLAFAKQKREELGWGTACVRLLTLLLNPAAVVERVKQVMKIPQGDPCEDMLLDTLDPSYDNDGDPHRVFVRRNFMLIAIHMIGAAEGDTPLHHFQQYIMNPKAVQGTFAFGDKGTNQTTHHALDCTLEGQSAVFSAEEWAFPGYYTYASIYLSGLLYPEKVAGWPYAVVSNVAAKSTGMHKGEKIVVAAIHMRRFFLCMEKLVGGDQIKVTRTNHMLCSTMVKAQAKATYATLQERQAVEKELLRLIYSARKRAECETLDVFLKDEKLKASLTLNTDLPEGRHLPVLPHTATGMLLKHLSEQRSTLSLLQHLHPMLDLYELVSRKWGDSACSGGGGEAMKLQDLEEGTSTTVEEGVAAYNKVVKKLPQEVALACARETSSFEEISKETEVRFLVTTGHGVSEEMGKILGIMQAVILKVGTLQSEVKEVVGKLDERWGGALSCEKVGQALQWVSGQRAGAMSPSFCRDAEMVLRMHNGGEEEDGENEAGAALYVVEEVGKLLAMQLSIEDVRIVVAAPLEGTGDPIADFEEAVKNSTVGRADLSSSLMQNLKELPGGQLLELQDGLKGLATLLLCSKDITMEAEKEFWMEEREDGLEELQKMVGKGVKMGHIPLLHRVLGKVIAENGNNHFLMEARRRFQQLNGEVAQPQGAEKTREYLQEFALAQKDKNALLEDLDYGLETILNSDRNQQGANPEETLMHSWGEWCEVFLCFTPDWTMAHCVAAFALLLEMKCEANFAVMPDDMYEE